MTDIKDMTYKELRKQLYRLARDMRATPSTGMIGMSSNDIYDEIIDIVEQMKKLES